MEDVGPEPNIGSDTGRLCLGFGEEISPSSLSSVSALAGVVLEMARFLVAVFGAGGWVMGSCRKLPIRLKILRETFPPLVSIYRRVVSQVKQANMTNTYKTKHKMNNKLFTVLATGAQWNLIGLDESTAVVPSWPNFVSSIRPEKQGKNFSIFSTKKDKKRGGGNVLSRVDRVNKMAQVMSTMQQKLAMHKNFRRGQLSATETRLTQEWIPTNVPKAYKDGCLSKSKLCRRRASTFDVSTLNGSKLQSAKTLTLYLFWFNSTDCVFQPAACTFKNLMRISPSIQLLC
uniref:Uncharacterized protein n=1 Tax=Romanomermis culicivorax TaxID=13658 RepID=A0A915HG89_ROMCU